LTTFSKNLRVNVFQVGPPFLEVREPLLLRVRRGIVVSVESVEEVVITLFTGIDSPR